MSTIDPKILEILDEGGVPEAVMDGSTIMVGDLAFSGTTTNAVADGRLQTSTPAKVADISRHARSAKEKNGCYTFAWAAPKGSVMLTEPKSNVLSLHCAGGESNYAAAIQANMVAMALCMSGNPTVPLVMRLVQSAISVNLKGHDLDDDGYKITMNLLFDCYADKVEASFNETRMPWCQIYIGKSTVSRASVSVYASAKSIATGIPDDEQEEYAKVVARINWHMLHLSGHPLASSAGPS